MRTGPLIWLCFLLLLCNLIVKSDQFPQSSTNFAWLSLFEFTFEIACIYLLNIISLTSLCTANLTNSITEDDQDITPKTIDPTFFLFSTETDVQVFKYYTDFSEFTWYNSSKDLRFVIHGWTDYFESGNWMDVRQISAICLQFSLIKKYFIGIF